MPAWKSVKPLLLAVLLAGAPAPAARAAGFEVLAVQPRVHAGRVVVHAAMDLDLSEAAERALVSGIPLDILLEFRLCRRRPLWWDQTLGRWTLRARLSYHALSGLYLVRLGEGARLHSFATQRAALKYLGTVDRISFPLPADAPAGSAYRLDLRVRLDREALPLPLRPIAYTAAAWRLDSHWTEWTFAPSSAG